MLIGDEEKALDVLQGYANAGADLNFLEENLAFPNMVQVYHSLKHRPRFIQLLNTFEERRLKQLANIRDWEENGLIPKVPDL